MLARKILPCSAAWILLVCAVTACAPSPYVVREPSPSTVQYRISGRAIETTLSVIDGRPDTGDGFSHGRVPASLDYRGKSIQPVDFLVTQLEREFDARNVPISVTRGAEDIPRLRLRQFEIINHRTSSFSPFVTFTLLSADLETEDDSIRLGVFIKRGKLPVWSFEEVVEPTLNQPLSLVVKELAAKIASHLYHASAEDRIVQELLDKLSTSDEEDNFLTVYELGFSNNSGAIHPVKSLSESTAEYERLAAISSLGILNAQSEFDYLKSIYEDGERIWQDRAMALKAIGDLSTDQTKAFIVGQKRYWEQQPKSKESEWILHVIRLYK